MGTFDQPYSNHNGGTLVSDRTVICTFRPETEVVEGILKKTVKIWIRCLEKFFESMLIILVNQLTPSRKAIHLLTTTMEMYVPKYGRTDYEIRGKCRLIRKRVIYI